MRGNTGIRSPWREDSRKVIQSVMRANPDTDEQELRKLISAAYPFGQRQYHPYKIWCSEVRAQMDLRKTKPASQADYNDTPLFEEQS